MYLVFIKKIKKGENTMELKTMYAILDVNIHYDFTNDDDDHIIYKADNMEAINAELIRIGADDEHYSIEEYRVDEDGEFYDGSDYDTPSNFRKRNLSTGSGTKINSMGMTAIGVFSSLF